MTIEAHYDDARQQRLHRDQRPGGNLDGPGVDRRATASADLLREAGSGQSVRVGRIVDQAERAPLDDLGHFGAGPPGTGKAAPGWRRVDAGPERIDQRVQRLGTNVDMTDRSREGGRTFLNVEGGKGVMVVDPAEAELVEVFDDHMARVNEKGWFGADPTTEEKFKRVLSQVMAVATSKEDRDEKIRGTGSEDLGAMVKAGFTMCWEKATFAHLLLSELGVRSAVVAGKDKADSASHHAWVELFSSPYTVEATAGFAAPTAEYRTRFDVYQEKTVAEPRYGLIPADVTKMIDKSGKVSKGVIAKLAV